MMFHFRKPLYTFPFIRQICVNVNLLVSPPLLVGVVSAGLPQLGLCLQFDTNI